ncbi:Structural maintenance of chromosomes protein 5 [Chionoecetes opilio]|uniref:Structural maintenance of chromosomes protein 5 n=1 Tax=Chionoecetes opilio TaxID=41210 RepID=A0A8J4YAU8_CHIOP|nr:Structural maintenance of chromosomes protein 5 [Chionoecetes opilio]
MSRLGIMTVQEINEEIRQKFQNSSLEDTERLLAEKEAHLDCLVTASSAELQEFKDGLKKLTRLQEELRDVGHNLQTYQLDLEGVKGSWLPHITTLVGDINNKFSQFMANMGYAGEVTLNADEDDFSTYGIAIKVKFRDAQRLQQLTAQQQSGGERAVSTALYMLALQSLSTAPFRCVDEINQGMDKINEKKMLEMLMETEGSEDSSQYFFVTPKLLQDISYSGSVNVMVVFNSPNTISHRRFTMQRCLKRQKERNRN